MKNYYKICKDTRTKIKAIKDIKNLLGYGYLSAPIGSLYFVAIY